MFLDFSNILLGRRQWRAQAEELRFTSFFSNELLQDTYEPQGFGGFMGYRRFRRPLPIAARRFQFSIRNIRRFGGKENIKHGLEQI